MVSAEIDGQIDDDLIDKLLLEQRERERGTEDGGKWSLDRGDSKCLLEPVASPRMMRAGMSQKMLMMCVDVC